MESIQTETYPIHFSDPAAHIEQYVAEQKPSKVFFIADELTAQHCLPKLTGSATYEYDIIEVPYGEEHKTIDFCIGIWDLLLDFGAERSGLVINVGGGVVTDMGGFAASTFKRGLRFIQVPTTLLSMVDASVGGKTGIDIRNVKNCIGTFTEPEAVLIDAGFLKTLNDRQLRSGFAEMLKHGLIADATYFDELAIAGYRSYTEQQIHRSVEIKHEVVKIDPREKGLRKTLNFGHTIGHAVEGYSLMHDQDPLLHGEAIAIGMIAEAWISFHKNSMPEADLQKITETFLSIYPKYELNRGHFSELILLMKNDKKNQDGRIGVALLNRIGHCDFDLYASEENIIQALNYYANFVVTFAP
ncbi:MAG: 3-dehydroquinate synthase [Mucilaginibacter polytrichastri]|nr:3-dehydroquinate synthase [Mucilaginibacter polytrichastri]